MEDLLASPARVVRAVLIGEGFGVMPGIRQVNPDQSLLVDPPQIFTESFSDDINYAIFLKDMPGKLFGENMMTGDPFEHPGVNVTVRHPDDRGYTLIKGIYEVLSRLKNISVVIGSYRYNIQGLNRSHTIMYLGEEEEKARLRWTYGLTVVFQEPPRTLLED